MPKITMSETPFACGGYGYLGRLTTPHGSVIVRPMIRHRVLRFIFAVALGLVLFDSVADAAGCDDAKATATACHACSCGPHLVSPAVVEIVAAPVPVRYVSYKPVPYAFLLPTSIFHPPCLAA